MIGILYPFLFIITYIALQSVVSLHHEQDGDKGLKTL